MASAEEKADYLFSEDLVRSHNSAASMHTEHLCLFANYVESKDNVHMDLSIWTGVYVC